MHLRDAAPSMIRQGRTYHHQPFPRIAMTSSGKIGGIALPRSAVAWAEMPEARRHQTTAVLALVGERGRQLRGSCPTRSELPPSFACGLCGRTTTSAALACSRPGPYVCMAKRRAVVIVCSMERLKRPRVSECGEISRFPVSAARSRAASGNHRIVPRARANPRIDQQESGCWNRVRARARR